MEVEQNKELFDAYQIAEYLKENNKEKDKFVITEGYDLYDIINSVVVLYNACKCKDRIIKDLKANKVIEDEKESHLSFF